MRATVVGSLARIMQKKIVIFISVFLFFLNIICWQEIFILAEPQYLTVDFLDVGQGDSAFIQTPGNRQILIDGGPDSSLLQKLSELMPFWDKSIDVVILTHPEKDHMSGLLEILKRYKVGYFLWTGVVKNDAENRQLITLLEKVETPHNSFLASLSKNRPTNVMAVNAGDKIKIGNVSINILYPVEDLNGKEVKNTSNDTGVVSKITFGNSSFLFTGDISFKAEKELINSGENILADVLKIAHHGSKYSTSENFLQNVSPQHAVIEVGKNSYGHPTAEVLNRLEKFGIKVKRTDKDGDIRFVSDGNNIKLIK